MNKEELAIAKEALYQYELERIKHIEALPKVDFIPSEEYERKKEELRAQIRNNTIKSRVLTNKQKLTLVIAAALISALIATACVFGNQIKGFFVDFFDSFVATHPSENPIMYCKEHKLTWTPEDYIEISKATFNGSTKTVYSNEVKTIDFIYYPVTYFYSIIDTQRAEFEIFHLGDKEIYYKDKNTMYAFYWVNDDATFYLSCDTGIEWSDIEKMISSVRSDDEKTE